MDHTVHIRTLGAPNFVYILIFKFHLTLCKHEQIQNLHGLHKLTVRKLHKVNGTYCEYKDLMGISLYIYTHLKISCNLVQTGAD